MFAGKDILKKSCFFLKKDDPIQMYGEGGTARCVSSAKEVKPSQPNKSFFINCGTTRI